MVRVTETTTVAAPRDRVFAFMDDPHNQPVITPSLRSVSGVEPAYEDGVQVGKTVETTYGMAGVELDVTLTTATYDPPEHVVFEMRGDLDGEIEWRFDAEDDGTTTVTYAAEYEIPVPVGERAVEPLVRRYNERELSTTLANLRTRLEAADGTDGD